MLDCKPFSHHLWVVPILPTACHTLNSPWIQTQKQFWFFSSSKFKLSDGRSNQETKFCINYQSGCTHTWDRMDKARWLPRLGYNSDRGTKILLPLKSHLGDESDHLILVGLNLMLLHLFETSGTQFWPLICRFGASNNPDLLTITVILNLNQAEEKFYTFLQSCKVLNFSFCRKQSLRLSLSRDQILIAQEINWIGTLGPPLLDLNFRLNFPKKIKWIRVGLYKSEIEIWTERIRAKYGKERWAPVRFVVDSSMDFDWTVSAEADGTGVCEMMRPGNKFNFRKLR